MGIVSTLKQRGLIQDVSDESELGKHQPGDSFYLGLDPTAPSLHIGNLVPIMAMVHITRAGLSPILLFGGATAAIGDPSGKSEERKLLDRKEIDQNIDRQKTKTLEIFKRVDITPKFVNNLDWTKDIQVIDFLRDIGKYFTVNYMIAKDVVKARLGGEGISFTEFSYMLLQAMDYLYLYENEQCRLQIGGSDQWGNITAGLELIRKKGFSGAHALSSPLLTDSQGKKFGKTESGAVWLDGEMLSPYKFYQYWLNVSDQDVGRLLRIFTLLEESEIAALEKSAQDSPEKREGQLKLAEAVCTLIHGEKATEFAKKSSKVLFGGSIEGLSEAQLIDIFSDVPSSTLSEKAIRTRSMLELFVETGLAKSKGEARRLISSGGAYINNERIADVDQQFSNSPAAKQGVVVLRSGKKNYHLVRIES